MDCLPELKNHMKAKKDDDLLALHKATINPTQIRPIWSNAVQHYKRIEHKLTLHDYIARYENRYGIEERYMYDESNNESIMSKEESIKAMKFSLAYHNIDYEEWLTLAHNIFNKTTTNKKENSLCIYGDSNAGKSWIIQPLQKVCNQHTINGGGGTAEDGQFKFMGMVGKRWALFNEMIVSDLSAEKMKEILGGENAEVPVKFAAPTRIGRIPCFITCNHEPFKYVTSPQNKTALNNRCKTYNWRVFPWEQAPWENKSACLHPGCYSLTENNPETTDYLHYEQPLPQTITDNIGNITESLEQLLHITKPVNKGIIVLTAIGNIIHSLIGDAYTHEQALDFWGHLSSSDTHDIHTCNHIICNMIFNIKKSPVKRKAPHSEDDVFDLDTPHAPKKHKHKKIKQPCFSSDSEEDLVVQEFQEWQDIPLEGEEGDHILPGPSAETAQET
uniref:Putative non-structural NS1 n=1 Tax=Caledonia starfish parvo-like virus 3 TaxID=2021900 RepID=A0A221LFN9_9VIRU|nr:putative non-structural NS1 [Caledonia starfish parvo-like virus 3]